MEVGMGIHGEPGMYRKKLASADEVADSLTHLILEDLEVKENDDVSVLVNGLGSTPLQELYIVYRKIHKILSAKNINIYRSYIREDDTTMETCRKTNTIVTIDAELKII